MRTCLLKAGLSRTRGSAAFALSSPRAWLGLAYHEVLEKITRVNCQPEVLDSTVDSLWNQAITKQLERASGHPLNRRFGSPETWPGYYVAQASVHLRAHELVDLAAVDKSRRLGPTPCVSSTTREETFAACDGKLMGRPDVVRDGEILDYKTGDIFERGENNKDTNLKASYVRQLRLYAFLASSALSVSIHRGVLYPITGQPVEVELNESTCRDEAQAALTLLDRYNNLVSVGADPNDFASPAPDTCCLCPFQIICPALWSAVNDNWFGKLDGELLRGAVSDGPKLLLGGEAFTLTVIIQAGTVKPGRLELFPLTVEVHQDISALKARDSIRITGLGRRLDSTVFPSKRTILIEESNLPEIKAAPNNKPVPQNATTKGRPEQTNAKS